MTDWANLDWGNINSWEDFASATGGNMPGAGTGHGGSNGTSNDYSWPSFGTNAYTNPGQPGGLPNFNDWWNNWNNGNGSGGDSGGGDSGGGDAAGTLNYDDWVAAGNGSGDWNTDWSDYNTYLQGQIDAQPGNAAPLSYDDWLADQNGGESDSGWNRGGDDRWGFWGNLVNGSHNNHGDGGNWFGGDWGDKNKTGYGDWESSWEAYQGYLDQWNSDNTQGPLDMTAQVVPGVADPNAPNQINVADYGGQLVADPTKGMRTDDPNTPQNESMFMQDHAAGQQMTGNEAGTNIDGTRDPYQMFQIAAQAYQAAAAQGQLPQGMDANTYIAKVMSGEIQPGQAANGQLSDGSIIDPNGPQLDTEAIGNGQTATGRALNDAAYQNIQQVLDTSNPLERAMANSLGKFGYIDSKATVQGQLAQLQEQFVDAAGNPKIPAWAAGTARNVAKIATFSGMTGTAATSAMAQAIMEASIPIAAQDAQFFQTVTLQNLSNEQESIINKANVLSKMDMMNLDNRMAAAVQNSKNFLAMDVKNLDNAQQMSVLNTQQRFQGLLEDSKQINAQRLFEAESQNDMDRFYAELGQQMEQFNVNQLNGMEMFNTDALNSISQFNANLESQRDQFYSTMQYNIDLANARWRQEVTATEDAQAFEAAAVDVQNMLNISQEQLAQIWDRADSLLDYIWKGAENEADRATSLAIAELQARTSRQNNAANIAAADAAGTASIWGTIAGEVAGGISSSIDWGGLFGL